LSLTGLGVAYRHLESYDAAIDSCSKALAILKGTQNKWSLTWVLQSLAEAYCDQGRPSDAVDLYQQALAILREVGDRWGEAESLADLGQAQRAGGQPDAARQSWHQALIMFEEFGDARADRIRAQLKELSVEENQLG
jgi:tetratricopeptide (TPR) repeat protein